MPPESDAIFRASIGPLAELCAYAPIAQEACAALSSAEADAGNEVHDRLRDVARGASAMLTDADPPWLQNALQIVATLCAQGRVLAVEKAGRITLANGLSISLHYDIAIRGEDGVIEVWDWKSGDGSEWSTGPAWNNLQLASYAFDARAGRIRIVHVRRWGETMGREGADPFEITPAWLHEMAARLEGTAVRVKAARAGLTGPEPGEHCSDCYGAPACPWQQARKRELLATAGEALTPGQLGELLAQLPAVEKAAKVVRAAAQSMVQATGEPLTTPDGRRWGRKEVSKRKIDPGTAWPLILGHLGARANDTLRLPMDALKDAAHASGGPPAVRAILAELEAAGAITTDEETQYGWLR